MQPGSLSSGDVLADRRAAYAKMLADEGAFAEAAEIQEQALERAPDWRAGWFRLGEYREKAKEAAGAVAAFRKVLELGGDDVFGATLKLAVLGADKAPAKPQSRYAQTLFDEYAGRFERSLSGKLGYDLPARLAVSLRAFGNGAPDYALAVDLGCGTGLVGPQIRPFVRHLEGFDISANMLAKAAEKRVYDHLARADLSLPPRQSGLFGAGLPPHRADLALAADVMIYLGDLERPFALAAELLAPGGLFAFSVEAAEGDGYVLQPSLRYAHSRPHVETLLAAHGFVVRLVEPVFLRMDAGNPVSGSVFWAVKQ